MIRPENEIELELAVNSGFEVRTVDIHNVEIQGEFDKNQIISTVQDWDEDPEDVCSTVKLNLWAEENGYVLGEE